VKFGKNAFVAISIALLGACSAPSGGLSSVRTSGVGIFHEEKAIDGKIIAAGSHEVRIPYVVHTEMVLHLYIDRDGEEVELIFPVSKIALKNGKCFVSVDSHASTSVIGRLEVVACANNA